MERTKLTSIRLESDVYDKIEELAKVHSYWKKSNVINSLLAAVLFNFDSREIYDMLRTYNWNRNRVDCKFEITKDLCDKKRKWYG